MIRSMDKLIEKIGQGYTFTRGKGMKQTDEKERWHISETGETVHDDIATRAIAFSVIDPIQFDLMGDPMQWGNRNAMARNGR